MLDGTLIDILPDLAMTNVILQVLASCRFSVLYTKATFNMEYNCSNLVRTSSALSYSTITSRPSTLVVSKTSCYNNITQSLLY